LAASLFKKLLFYQDVKKDPPVGISQETLLELFEEIRDKLDELGDKLDHLIDQQPTSHYSNHSLDSNLNNFPD